MTGGLLLLDSNRPIRIFLVAGLASSLRNFRGPLIKEMISHGYEVHVAAPGVRQDSPTLAWLSAVGATAHDIDLARTGISPTADLKNLLQLYRLMRQIRPALFLGYTIKPVIWGLLAARLAHVPRRVALITGLGYAFTDGAGLLRRLMRLVVKGLYKAALRWSTLVFFQNPDDHADFHRMGLIPAHVPVQVVSGSGIDLERFPMEPMPPMPVKFVLIARLLADKGVREYVAAARLLRKDWPEVEFHLVGGTDPNPAGIPDAEVKSWHADADVIWHGHLSDVRPTLAQAHVYVLPSYREGMPRTVLEAMATGRAVITTDAPGCRQAVAEGETGFLVPVRDVEALAAAMCRFLQEPHLIERLGCAGRARAENVFDVNRVNADMLLSMGLAG